MSAIPQAMLKGPAFGGSSNRSPSYTIGTQIILIPGMYPEHKYESSGMSMCRCSLPQRGAPLEQQLTSLKQSDELPGL